MPNMTFKSKSLNTFRPVDTCTNLFDEGGCSLNRDLYRKPPKSSAAATYPESWCRSLPNPNEHLEVHYDDIGAEELWLDTSCATNSLEDQQQITPLTSTTATVIDSVLSHPHSTKRRTSPPSSNICPEDQPKRCRIEYH